MLAAATTETTPARRPPLDKAAMRLLRSSIADVAKASGLSILGLEEIYSNTRSALAHLLAHDRYRTKMEDKVSDLMRAHREFLDHPGAAEYLGGLDVKAISAALSHFERERAALGEPRTSHQRRMLDIADRGMAAMRAILERPEIAKELGEARVQRMEEAAASLDEYRLEMLQRQGVTPTHVSHFFTVLDSLREKYEQEHYSFEGVVPEPMLQLARLVLVNFEAYNKTLNT